MSNARSFFASIFQLRDRLRGDRRAIVARRRKQAMKDALLDLLEERQLLATFSFNSGTGVLSVVSNAVNDSTFALFLQIAF
jgi:hypothetical protein